MDARGAGTRGLSLSAHEPLARRLAFVGVHGEGERWEGERERERERECRPSYPYISRGVEILTVPGQASSSEFCRGFDAENGEFGGLNEGWDEGVGWAEGKEGKDGGTEAIAARPKKTREMGREVVMKGRRRQGRKRHIWQSSRGSRYGAWGNGDSSTKGKEGGHEEGTSPSDVRSAGTGLRASGEDNRGGGVLVRLLSTSEGVGAEREMRAKLLTWRTREEAVTVIELAIVKAFRVLGFRPMESSCVGSSANTNPPGSNTKLRRWGVYCSSRNRYAKASRDFKLAASLRLPAKISRLLQNSDSGEIADEASDGVTSREREFEPIDVTLSDRCGGSEWGKMGASSGASRREEIETDVSSSGLGEGGVTRPFGESLSSPGGVRTVDNWWGETGTLSENLSGGGSRGTMSLDDKGGRFGEFSETASESRSDAGVDLSSRSPSARDGDSVAGGKSLDAWETGSKHGVEIDGEVSKVKGKRGDAGEWGEASFVVGISDGGGVESSSLGEGVEENGGADDGAGARGTDKGSEIPSVNESGSRGVRGKARGVKGRDAGRETEDAGAGSS
ncbi:hypothetical protein EDB85DRAFT_2274879 [Lactarius pseudohatsudake]|nr:hypothetical protein EDB85DRAFT_2274879 [Lactarius pseudohatsudake]